MFEIGDPQLVTVVATCLAGLGVTGFLNGWADHRFSWLGLIISIGAGVLFVALQMQDPITISTIPEAFVEIVARIIR